MGQSDGAFAEEALAAAVALLKKTHLSEGKREIVAYFEEAGRGYDGGLDLALAGTFALVDGDLAIADALQAAQLVELLWNRVIEVSFLFKKSAIYL